MILEYIFIKQFRNYTLQEIAFNPRINIFYGPNAQGKTNLLEAIYYLASSRSFRTNTEQELVSRHSSFFFLKGVLAKRVSRTGVEIGYQSSRGLQIKLGGMIMKRADYIHRHPVVVFSPDDLSLIKEGPAERRRFLNLEGSRLKPLYYRRLRDYHRVLQQRNRLLKEARQHGRWRRDCLEPWSTSLVSLGSAIIKERIILLRELEEESNRFFNRLTGSSEKLRLRYESSLEYSGINNDEEELQRLFHNRLKEVSALEQRKGYTLVGPHLDDFTVLIDDYEAKKFASQGQQRTAALALKMGEVELFYRFTGEKPLILLDDVFSELDRDRRLQLLHFLLQREGQSFITTAVPLDPLPENFANGSVVFLVNKGKIIHERTG